MLEDFNEITFLTLKKFLKVKLLRINFKILIKQVQIK